MGVFINYSKVIVVGKGNELTHMIRWELLQRMATIRSFWATPSISLALMILRKRPMGVLRYYNMQT